MNDSDFPTHHTDSHIEDMFWIDEERAEAHRLWGPDTTSAKYHQRLRSLYIEHIPEYAEAITEEIEAQLHYNDNKSKKKSDPKTYYAARERLYQARHAVNHLTHTFYTSERTWGFANKMWDSAFSDNDPIKAALDRQLLEEWQATHPSAAEQAKRRSQNKETFADWLREERTLYETALAEPWRVFLASASSEEVYRKRVEYLMSLQQTLDHEGLEAAFTRHTTVIEEDAGDLDKDTGALTAEVLEPIYTDEFVAIGRPTASGKNGYRETSSSNLRPVLLDSVKDAEKIKRRRS